jgi:Ion channel
VALLLTSLIGITLIFAVFRDVFHTLFPYAGKLAVSSLVAKAFWRGLHRLGVRRPQLLYAVGPVAFLATIGGWFVLLAFGWALIYWPHMPSAFAFGEGLDATTRGSFADALYFSLGTQATLGYGDIVPTNPWLMMGTTLQAMSGLGVLLAALSWYLAINQALSQCRSLAHRITLVREAEPYAELAVTRMKPEATRLLLDDFATRLAAVRGEFLRFPITYYYGTNDEHSSLPTAVPYLVWLAEEGGREDRPPEVRIYAATLHGAIDHFSATIASRFLDVAPSPRVLQEYSRDHLCERHPKYDAEFP